MPRENLKDLLAFLAVTRESGRAGPAAKRGVSRVAPGHAIRGSRATGCPIFIRATAKWTI
jgi:hypothetical protein